MPPITIMNGLLPMTDPSAPAPKPSKMKHTEIPATKRTLLRMTRSLRRAGLSPPEGPPEENSERYTGSSGTIQGEKKQQPRREHRSQIQ